MNLETMPLGSTQHHAKARSKTHVRDRVIEGRVNCTVRSGRSAAQTVEIFN